MWNLSRGSGLILPSTHQEASNLKQAVTLPYQIRDHTPSQNTPGCPMRAHPFPTMALSPNSTPLAVFSTTIQTMATKLLIPYSMRLCISVSIFTHWHFR